LDGWRYYLSLVVIEKLLNAGADVVAISVGESGGG
jgi:hypothetical protein